MLFSHDNGDNLSEGPFVSKTQFLTKIEETLDISVKTLLITYSSTLNDNDYFQDRQIKLKR